MLLQLGDISQANAVTAIYGDSGSGKSSLADTAAEYGWARYHKITRVTCADLGGFGTKRTRLIRLGIVQAYNPLNHVEPFETMEDLSKGYWPETILDPFTGYADPQVKLIPPETTNWSVYCNQGHLVKTVQNKRSLEGFSLQCPTCKAVVNPQNWGRVEELTVRDPWIKHVGLYIFDSGTALEDWAMEDMADKAAKNDPGVKDGNSLSNTGARVLSGKYAFGANTQQHYGFSQNRMRAWIKNSRSIPGQVIPAVFTFLEQRATDDNKSISVFGPKISGNAKTPEVPSWVGSCINVSTELNDKGKRVWRMWLVNHTDANSNVPHLAKTRVEPGVLPPYIDDEVDTAGNPVPFSRFNLGYMFDRIEMSLNETAKVDADAFPDAPVFMPLDTTTPDVITRRDLSGNQIGLRAGAAPRQVPTAPAAKAAMLAPKPAVSAPTPTVKPVAPTPVTATGSTPVPATVSKVGAVQPSPAATVPVTSTAPAVTAAQPAVAGGAPKPGPRLVPVAGKPIPKPAAPVAPAPAQPAQPVTPPVAAAASVSPTHAAAVSPTVAAVATAQGAPKNQPAGRPPTPPAVVRAGAPPPPGRKN
jgi:hypothetical protein